MRLPRITTRRLMIAMVSVARLNVWLGVPGVAAWSGVIILILCPIAFAFLAPFVLARPGPSLAVAIWSPALYPALFVWGVNVAFGAAWVAHGHRPGVLDYGTFVHFVGLLTLFLLVTAPLATLVCLAFTVIQFGAKIDLGDRPPRRLFPVLTTALVWVVVLLIISDDNLGAFEWYMD